MSFAMLVVNVGFVGSFISMWMKAWGTGFAVGFPAAAIIVPSSRIKLLVFPWENKIRSLRMPDP
jgi:hypothetical protein